MNPTCFRPALFCLHVLLLVAAAAPAFAQEARSPSWTELAGSGSGGGISPTSTRSRKPAMALDPLGYPVIAWNELTSGTHKIYVRRWNGTAWAELGGSGSGTGILATADVGIEGPAIALDASGNPTVAWSDDGNSNSEIYVCRWTGSSWEELAGSATGGGISNTASASEYPSVAVDGSGNPCVAWQEDSDIFFRRWNGSSWEEIGGSATWPGLGGNTQLLSTRPNVALDGDGNPMVAWEYYQEANNPEVYLLRWDGADWVPLGGSFGMGGISVTPGSVSTRISIAVDGAGYPVVAWYEYSSGPAEIYLRRWNGSAWIELGGSASGAGLSNTAGWSYSPSVAIDALGNPVVAWSEQTSGNYEIYLRRWDGAAWREMDGSASGGGLSGSIEGSAIPVLAADPDGDLFVAWDEAITLGQEVWLRTRTNMQAESLGQMQPDGVTVIPMAGTANQSAVILRGTPATLLPGGPMRLQVEARLVGTDFTGASTAVSGEVSSGETASVSVQGLAAGYWHWRARAINSGGGTSEWISFGSNLETLPDFVVPEPPPPVDVSPSPSGGGGGGGGGIGCGLTGLEALLLFVALRSSLKRLRRRPMA